MKSRVALVSSRFECLLNRNAKFLRLFVLMFAMRTPMVGDREAGHLVNSSGRVGSVRVSTI